MEFPMSNSSRYNRFSEPIVRVNLWVRKDLYFEVSQFCEEEKSTVSDFIRQAIGEAIDRKRRKKRKSDERDEEK